eukprot:Gregarina_sp_Poly_1__6058@NODE_3199_length_1281_cov_17_490939_g2031_i0_p3_GENE_NODE_3199_length_1281_cov_17_490939_g2031_i0NODE_3199_length_1281_cov_17_490939_g2031_i0_p3_ORF_typecomplete_len107_score2_22DUF3931/PF13082_6/0_27_NODE_3199_length_1281_cov_17_490939_g2031_i08031123
MPSSLITSSRVSIFSYSFVVSGGAKDGRRRIKRLLMAFNEFTSILFRANSWTFRRLICFLLKLGAKFGSHEKYTCSNIAATVSRKVYPFIRIASAFWSPLTQNRGS